MNDDLNRLPRELADRFTKPFAQFLRIEATGAGILLLLTIAALALAVTMFPIPGIAAPYRDAD